VTATQLLIRLSDESAWSCEPFSATSADELRDGALEAFACLRTDWRGLVDSAIPVHQTIRRSARYAQRPRTLYVQICYHGEWCAQPWTPTITEPGAAPGAPLAWTDENWADAWARCLRTFDHVHKLGTLGSWVNRP